MNSNLKKMNTSQGYICTKVTALENTRDNLLAITNTFEEIEVNARQSKVLILDSTNRTATNDLTDEKPEPWGIILFALINMDMEYAGMLQWDNSHHVMMSKHKKPNFDSDSKHHGSKWIYYSYGNKENFGMVGLSSVS